jgi:hypothetical protein
MGRPVILLVLALTFTPAATAQAQHMVEVRGADTEYRFVDWNYTSQRGLVADVFYVGVPDSNELNVGGGIALTRGPVIVTPLLYAVVGKEGGQRGVKIAVLVMVDRRGWKLTSFLGHYAALSGDVDSYLVLDTLDVTRALGKGWELGAQAGFFRTAGEWNQQIGPLIRHNDRHGAWAMSYRFGPQRELRVGRVMTF